MTLTSWRKLMNDKVRRYRYEKFWWLSNMPAATAVYFFAPGLWSTASILYLNLVSIYALVITAGGAEQAAEAAREAKTD